MHAINDTRLPVRLRRLLTQASCCDATAHVGAPGFCMPAFLNVFGSPGKVPIVVSLPTKRPSPLANLRNSPPVLGS